MAKTMVIAMNKKIIRIVAAFAVAVIISSFGAIGTSAAQMKDVRIGDWFYSDVTRLTDAGVLGGYPDGCFYPNRQITCAEFTKVLLSCIGADTDVTGTTVLFKEHWASKHITAAYAGGIITDSDLATGFSPDKPITRGLMTKMAVLALELEPAYIESPFVDADDPYANAAYSAYLLRGYDTGFGTLKCNKDQNATRAEASAIAVRILDYKTDSYEYLKKAILDNASTNSLDTEAELVDFFYVLNRELITEYTFKTKFSFEKWSQAYSLANQLHFESFYSEGCDCSYIPGNTTYTIKPRYTQSIRTLKNMKETVEAEAKKITDTIISEDMTKTQKARAIHDYLVLNCKYDYANYQKGTIPEESYLAYGAMCKKTAVCQGYTNAFNLLSKYAGLASITVSGTAPTGPGHAWNAVLIDGNIYYIDTTFDDPTPDVEGRVMSDYFMLDETQMAKQGYRWDKSTVKVEYFH